MTKEVLSAIQDAVGTQVFGIWFLIGAAFVFFMQAGVPINPPSASSPSKIPNPNGINTQVPI